MKAKIYLDFNSTHPPDPLALKTGRDFYLGHFANSSGLSLESQAVNKRIEESREQVARLLGVAAQQVLFTSCATESNNLLIREFFSQRRGERFRVLSSPFEHPSVSECLKQLPGVEIVFLKSDSQGTIDPAQFSGIDWPSFDLIVMMAVQNESGVILPLAGLADALPEEHPPVLADFSQGLPKMAADAVAALQPQAIARLTEKNFFVTATGHKVGAGFGAGLIVTPNLGKRWKEVALLAGGNQEHGLRAGSHNAEAIISFGEALQRKITAASWSAWRQTTADFERELTDKISPHLALQMVGSKADRAPGTTLLLLPGIPIDFLIMALDKEGITVSTGTSCKSRSRSPSAALLAMGYNEAEALSVVRLSYGQGITAEEIKIAAQSIAASVAKLAHPKQDLQDFKPFTDG